MATSAKPRRKFSPHRQRVGGARLSINELRYLFHPVVKLLKEMHADAVTSIRGVPMIRMPDGDFVEAGSFLVGWSALYLRVQKLAGADYDLEPLCRLVPRLNHGVPIAEHELLAAERAVNDCFLACQKIDRRIFKDCALTEQIAVEFKMAA